jgi:hypothetical protein
MDDGTRKETSLIVPAIVATFVAVVVTAVPPPGGVNVIVTFAGEIVPVGNPLPRRVILVTPACPVEGVIEVRDTDARADAPHVFMIIKRRMETNKKGFLRRLVVISIISPLIIPLITEKKTCRSP